MFLLVHYHHQAELEDKESKVQIQLMEPALGLEEDAAEEEEDLQQLLHHLQQHNQDQVQQAVDHPHPSQKRTCP